MSDIEHAAVLRRRLDVKRIDLDERAALERAIELLEAKPRKATRVRGKNAFGYVNPR